VRHNHGSAAVALKAQRIQDLRSGSAPLDLILVGLVLVPHYLATRKTAHRNNHFELSVVARWRINVNMARVFRHNGYWEVLIVLRGSTRRWEYPPSIPAKYASRIKAQSTVGCWVESAAHAKPYYTNCDLLQDGMWVCKDDFEPRGGVAPAVFGIPLPPSPFGPELEQWKSGPEVRVAYHGTSRENFESISSTGLRCTLGMLGEGVYLGSFWKACRFAARGQDYKERTYPTVVRVLWQCAEEDILKFPRKWIDGWCLCGKCYVNKEQREYCAHTYDWKADSKCPPPKPYYAGPWKAGQLLPCKYPSGKWVTQNEEWVLNPSCILSICQAVQLDMTTIARPHYDPLQRNIGIL